MLSPTERIAQISIQKLRNGDKDEVARLMEAAQTIGFFYAVDLGEDADKLAENRAIAREFFKLPVEEKNAMAMGNGAAVFRGYSALDAEITNGIPDHKETVDFGMDEEHDAECTKCWKVMHGPNLYPASMYDQMKNTVNDAMDAVNKIGEVILGGFAQGYGQKENFFSKHYERPSSQMRYLKYPPTNAKKLGIGEHTDFGSLSIIDQDDVGGLQAKTLVGQWIEVTPIKGSLAINIGDYLAGWSKYLASQTDGLKPLRSTPHRVFNKSNKRSRLSVAYFYEPGLAMEMPEGVDLTRNGGEPVKTYGEHIYRSLAASYPQVIKK